MELYLIRHGIAAERGTYAQDDERPLTEEGDRKTRTVARRMAELGLTFDLILTSPLVRARQTANILKAAKLSETVQESEYLAPGGDFKGWLTWLRQWQTGGGDRLALVGHEPDLSQWAERLVWGDVQGRLILKKAGIIGVDLSSEVPPVGKSQLFWLTPPRFLL